MKIQNLILLSFLIASGFSIKINSQVIGEYFFDTDPGVGQATPLMLSAQGSPETYTSTINTSGLLKGFHTFFVRLKTDTTSWSLLEQKPVYISDSVKRFIVEAEYFWDEDPGIGNATPLPLEKLSDTTLLHETTINPDMTLGEYTLYIRIKDNAGKWSLLEYRTVKICTQYGPISDFEIKQFNALITISDKTKHADSYLWDFGDGSTTDTSKSPTHIYKAPGSYTITLINENNCGTDTIKKNVIINGLEAITPHVGGQGGKISVSVTGFGLSDTDSLILKYSEDTNLVLIPDTFFIINSESMYVLLDLSTAPIGFYDVVLIDQQGNVRKLIKSFEVVGLIEPELTLQVSGPSLQRTNRFSTFQFTITNHGNVNAYMVPVFISGIPYNPDDPDPETFVEGQDMISPRRVKEYSEAVDSIIALGVDSTLFTSSVYKDPESGTISDSRLLTIIPPGKTVVSTSINSTSSKEVCIKVYIGKPMTSNSSSDCVATAAECAFEIALATLVPKNEFKECAATITKILTKTFDQVTGAGDLTDVLAVSATGGNVKGGSASKIVSQLSWGTHAANLVWDCGPLVAKSLPPGKFLKVIEIMKDLMKYKDGLNKATDAATIATCSYDTYKACWGENTEARKKEIKKRYKDKCVIFVSSIDPNDKSGPGQVGDNYVNTTNFDYTIRFENVDTATAAAQVVTIYDTLNTDIFDLSTFRFTGYGFDSNVIAVTTNKLEFADLLDLRPGHPNYLKVEGTLDTVSGIVKWLFTTLDTVNLQLTQEVFEGFLPPNVTSPEGEGFVSFTVDLLNTVSDGDLINNSASIIFDENKPILTNNWENTYDETAPSSNIEPLPTIINDTIISLDMNGFDEESGVRSYDIFVSIDDGEYIPVYTDLEANQVNYTGEFGKSYKFYSIATDSAGNIEAEPLSFDANTILEEPVANSLVNSRINNLDFNIYPVPANNEITISVNQKLESSATIKIFNVLGDEVFHQQNFDFSGSNDITMNVNQLFQGIYTIFISSGELYCTKKMVIK